MRKLKHIKLFENFQVNGNSEYELEVRKEPSKQFSSSQGKLIPSRNEPHPDWGWGYRFDFSILLDVKELSEEFGLNQEDLKKYIDELSETTCYVKNKMKITKEEAKEKLTDYLKAYRTVLVVGWNLPPELLFFYGIESKDFVEREIYDLEEDMPEWTEYVELPKIEKLIKEFKDLYQDKYFTRKKHKENIQKFLKERGY
jgi:hypothetical protein